MYLLYTSDIPKIVNSTIVTFAEDTALRATGQPLYGEEKRAFFAEKSGTAIVRGGVNKQIYFGGRVKNSCWLGR